MKPINRLKIEIEEDKIKILENNKNTVVEIPIYKKEPINKPKIYIKIEESNKIRV